MIKGDHAPSWRRALLGAGARPRPRLWATVLFCHLGAGRITHQSKRAAKQQQTVASSSAMTANC